MPLTILQLVPEALPTHRPDVAVLFGKYLPRAGVHCDMVGTSAATASDDRQGYASLRRPAWHGHRLVRELRFLGVCLRALLAANRRNCDLIQVRDMTSIGLLALVVARLKGIPFAYWMSFLMNEGRIGRARVEIAAGGGWRYRLVLLKGLIEQALTYRVVVAGADHVFVQSEAMKALLVGQGVPAAKLSAVPMGVDTELLRQGGAGQRLPQWQGRPVLAYLGTLDRSRQMERVLDALQRVRQRHPQASLLLIGDSPTPSDITLLLEHAEQLGLTDALHLTGWLPSQQAWQLLAGADAAISYIPRGALYDISSPTKLLEYLAIGIPSVGNDSPDQVGVLQGSAAGWLCDSNPESMAAAIGAIFDDLPAARARAAAGPAYIDRVRSYRVIAKTLAEQYQALAASAVSATLPEGPSQ